MKRWVARVGVLAAIGAAVNVAVAWAAVLLVPGPAQRGAGLVNSWPAAVSADWLASATVYEDRCIGLTEYNALGDVRASSGMAMQYALKSGLPWRTLQRSVNQVQFQGETLIGPALQMPSNWREGIALPERLNWMDRQYRRFLPADPIWIGFLGNTVFFGLLIGTIATGGCAMLSVLRPKAGLCPACRYPIGSSDVCSECGRPVTRLRATSCDEAREFEGN